MPWISKAELTRLTQEREEAEARLKEHLNAERERASNASFAVDFFALKPVSIERMVNDSGIAVTIFGYFDKDGNAREWYFECNQSIHNELVDHFGKWLLKKNGV